MLTATAQYMYLEQATFSTAQHVIVIVINQLQKLQLPITAFLMRSMPLPLHQTSHRVSTETEREREMAPQRVGFLLQRGTTLLNWFFTHRRRCFYLASVEAQRRVNANYIGQNHRHHHIIIFIFQNKELQSTIITIRQPENRMINKAGCL